MGDARNDAAAISMFESGWFGRTEAFWKWIKTPEAKPYIEAFIADRRRPEQNQPFNLLSADDDEPDLLDSDHLREVAARIERDYGDGGTP
jgi:hypothetical protein